MGQRHERLSGWRKIASAVWGEPSDPQIYGWLELDASAAARFMESARDQGRRVTPTHLVGRAIARALIAVPELNVRLVGDRAHPRESVDVFFITAMQQEKGRDLSGVKVTAIDDKDVFQVAEDLSRRSSEVRQGRDPALANAKSLVTRLPQPVLHVAMRAVAWATGERGWRLPWLGIEASPFGSAMVSSVGMLGLPTGFSPLVWLYRVPLLVLVGELSDKPLAIDGKVEIRPVLPVTFTVDHRYVDGAHLGKALSAFREYLSDPFRFEPVQRAEAPAPDVARTNGRHS